MTRGRYVVGAIVAVLAVMWIYVLFIGNPANVDKLHDPAYGSAAEPICKTTVDRLGAPGVVNQVTPSPQQRADG